MALFVALMVGAVPLSAQANEPVGFPIDWSFNHVVYPPTNWLAQWQAVHKDPRALYQEMVRNNRLTAASDSTVTKKKRSLKADWAVSLGTGAVAQNMSPAKYSYITTGTPSCNDWVVFGLNVPPAANQATLMAVNNLYGMANGCTASPGVLFAYETAGPIATSPVISFNDGGLQVAYVDNESSKATLVVLTYKSGDGTAAAAPVAVPGTGSKVSLQYSTTTNTNSSIYVDFSNDIAYVGDDGGTLYKISPVFGGGTPVTKAKATLAGKLSGPVLDQLHSVVLVGSSNGMLYSQKSSDMTAAAAAVTVGNGSTYGGIIDPQTVVTGTTTYAFATTDCNANGGGGSGILSEASVTASTLTQVASNNISEPAHACGANNLHAPALDDAVYNGSAGYLYVCGTTKNTSGTPSQGTPGPPVLYSFTFNPNSGVLGTSAAHTLTPSGTAATDECSPLSYFTSNSTSDIFFGMGTSTGSINSSTVTNTGSIGALTTKASPGGLGGTSGIIVDNSNATTSLANVYFGGLQAGNVTGGSCQTFTGLSASVSSGTVTVTGSSSFNFAVGQTVVISGFGGTNYNGTFETITGTTASTIKYTSSASGTPGTAGQASWGVCGFQLTQSGLN